MKNLKKEEVINNDSYFVEYLIKILEPEIVKKCLDELLDYAEKHNLTVM